MSGGTRGPVFFFVWLKLVSSKLDFSTTIIKILSGSVKSTAVALLVAAEWFRIEHSGC